MSDSDRSIKEKKKRNLKKIKQSEPDFSQWNEDQKKRFQAAKNEVEREVIIGEVQQKQDEEENNQQILQHKMVLQYNHNQGGQPEYHQSRSSSSVSSEEEESFSRPEDGEIGYPKKRARKQEDIEEPSIAMQKKSEFEEVIDSYEKAIRDVTLKRNQIDYLLMKVYYNKVIEGAFVRIQEPQFKKYALAQILAVVEGDKAYQLGDTMTYKLLKLQIAEIKEPKYRHITLVSNQKIETQEYILWKKNCEALGIPLPSKEQLSRKYKEISDAFKVKLTDEDIEKKIITTVEGWISQVKPQVHNNDLPVYQNFINNQISIQKQTLEQIDEFIQEITESQVQDANKVDEEEINKLVNWRRQQRGARDRLSFLQQQSEKIKGLYVKHQEKQDQNDLKSLAKDQQNNNNVSESLQTRPTRIYDSQILMKQMDKIYNKNQFEDALNYSGSEKLKMMFYETHNRHLEIDTMIDKFMLEEL